MNPYSGKIEKFTEEELKAANEALKQKYGQEAKQMVGLTDKEAKFDPLMIESGEDK